MKSIAVFALLATLAVFVAARPNKNDMEMAENAFKCMKEFNLKLEDFQKLKHDGDFKSADVSEDMKCAVHCMTQKMGAMDADGKLKPDEIRAMLDEEQKPRFEEALKECNEISGATPCETAFLTFGCMAKHQVNKMA